MEVKLDKRYPVAASLEQAWAVLSDVHAVARCMPGAAITAQIDDTHFKGTVKSKVGPAVMSFGGDIEVLVLDPAARALQLLGTGADKSGSSASMNLRAHLQAADMQAADMQTTDAQAANAQTGQAAGVLLVGQATITVSGKLAQFGSRLLVPVADAMLAQFADNFRAAAAAVPVAGAPGVDAPAAAAAAGVAPPPVQALNPLRLLWIVIRHWLAGLFRKKT